MKEETTCKHDYYIVKHLVVAEPCSLIAGETEEQKKNPIIVFTGKDVLLTCRNCYLTKKLNE